MGAQTFTIADVVLSAMEQHMTTVYTAMPGKVVSYDVHKRAASVQPLVWMAHEAEDGTRAVERLPVIPNVPVVFPGGRRYGIMFPIQVNDVVMLDVLPTCSWTGGKIRGGEVKRPWRRQAPPHR